VTLRGPGSGQGGPYLIYTSAAGSLISAREAFGLEIAHLNFGYSNAAYAGDVIRFAPISASNPTSYIRLHDCYFESGFGLNTARSWVSAKNLLQSTIDRNVFIGGANIGLHLGDGGDFANVNGVTDNAFSAQGAAGIYLSGTHTEATRLMRNTFEPILGGGAVGILQNAATINYGLTIDGNWFGDATVAGTWITVQGSGLRFVGNFGYTPAGGTVLNAINGSVGVEITGNAFLSGLNGISFAATVTAATVGANWFGPGLTAPITGSSNVTRLVLLPNYGLDSGISFGGSFVEGAEMTPPAAPAANGGRLYFDDSGTKTRLMVRFATGAAQVIAIEP
jgi:hypothetical protein